MLILVGFQNQNHCFKGHTMEAFLKLVLQLLIVLYVKDTHWGKFSYDHVNQTSKSIHDNDDIEHLISVANATRFKPNRFFKTAMLHKQNSSPKHLILLVLFMSGQVELNPGPTDIKSSFPCGICDSEVKDEDKGICCDNCSKWYHIDCTGMSHLMYDVYCGNSNLSWICIACGFPNTSPGIFDSTLLSTSNSYQILDSDLCSMSACEDEPFNPTQTSTPNKDQKSQSNKARKKVRPPKIKAMIVNCDGLHWPKRKAAFHATVNELKPDVIFGCESKLDPNIPTYSVFPEEYNITRKDRNANGGGVFVACRDNLITTDRPDLDAPCEVAWSTINFVGFGVLYLGSFYRPPSAGVEPLEHLQSSINKILNKNRRNSKIMLCGDFNLPDIDWLNEMTKPESKQKGLHNSALEIIGEIGLIQLVDKVTRPASNSILDLVFTNNSNMITNVQTYPGISDHDIVTCNINISPSVKRKPPRKIYQYHKSDTESLTASLASEVNTFFNNNPENNTVEINWLHFKNIVHTHMEKFIPHKMTKSKHSYPWISPVIVRQMRKRDKLYRKAKKAGPSTKSMLTSAYKKQRNKVTDLIRDGHESYKADIIGPSLDSNPKKFWSYIRSLRKESLGIPPQTVNGKTHATDKGIAEALNNQFTSVFTKERKDIPDKGASPFQDIPDLQVELEGVVKQLQQLNCNKAGGPDDIPARFLHDYSTELGPILQFIFQQSYDTSSLPSDWKKAMVTGIYKKGSKSSPENYRPISLTCITCKIMEHIVLSHTAKHLAGNNIIIDAQHGFREKLSCETQLIQATQDWSEVLNRGGQTDVLLLDFSKAFDKVPHLRLASKLKYYGIRGKTVNWIQDFLAGREQCVAVNGTHSQWSPVTSGVPQGSVLGPTLFLIYINDIVTNISSTLRLFADDSILYLEIKCLGDQARLQEDLNKIFQWADKWQMCFNAAKCEALTITRKTKALQHTYEVDGHCIKKSSKHKYLGVTINHHLDWKDHVLNITSSARSTMGILRRNLSSCPEKTKSKAYQALVRPKLEYASACWNPYAREQVNLLEAVQRQAARFVLNNYERTASVTQMLQRLEWDSLATRRLLNQCTMFFKIHHGLVSIPFPTTVIPSTRQGRNTNTMSYQTIQPRVNSYRYSFFVRIIPVWNRLPTPVTSAVSVRQFQSLALHVLRDMAATPTHQTL